MENKVLQVFFGTDNLPYKDKERTIHFPVTGSSFAGSNNTKTIRFYVDEIGGTDGVSWVVVSKLPNGKVGYEPLSAVGTDTLVGEKYLSFDLSSYYTQVKGIVKLALRGYRGEIQFVDEDDTGIYQIVGDPLIDVTGTIDFAINYSPLGNTGNQMLPSDVDRILDALDKYIKFGDGIVVIDDLDIDLTKYEHGQVFYNSSSRGFYEYSYNSSLDEWTLNPITTFTLGDGAIQYDGENDEINISNDNGNTFVFGPDGAFVDGDKLATEDFVIHHTYITITTELVKDYIGTFFIKYNTDYYLYICKQSGANSFDVNLIKFDYDNNYYYKYVETSGNSTIASLLSSMDGQFATQSYVQNQIAQLGNVLEYKGTKTVAELNALTGQQIGDTYNVSDSGTLNAGNVEVIAGDNVAWNGSAWDKLAGTVDLSGLVEKTSSANKVYGTNDQGAQTLYTVDDFYDGNIARRDSDGSITVPLTPSSNGEATSKKYVDDLFGSISYDNALSDSSTNAVQNKVITQHVLDLQYRVSLLEEAILSEDTLFYTYLSESLIPQVSDNSYPIIQSAGLDTKEIKGRSFVYNQILQNGNFASDDGWSKQNATLSVSSNVGTMLATAQYGQIRHEIANVVSGHKYLISLYIKTTTATTSVLVSFYGGSNYNNKSVVSTTSKQLLQYLATPTQSGTYILMIRDDRTSAWDNIEISSIMVTDLTQSDIDSATTVDEAIALLQQNGINPYEYNSYNVGDIIDSKPTAIVSKGFNIWDEQWEVGGYLSANGEKDTTTNKIRSKNKIRIIPNTNYYACNKSGRGYFTVFYYDNNNNYLGYSSYNSQGNRPFTTLSNASYITFQITSEYGTTYKNDVCINLSSTLNGTYKPYKAPITYSLDVPVLRSAGSVQDNNLKVNIGVVKLKDLDYIYENGVFRISGTLSPRNKPQGKLFSNLYLYESGKYPSNISDKSISNGEWYFSTNIFIKDSSYTDATIFKNHFGDNDYLYYELDTPTDQPTITLPENIEIELGGSLEIVYDNGHTTPCDFTFDTAVYKPIQ